MSSTQPTRDIDFLLEEVVTLPSLPRTVAHITQLVSDPNCSLAAVGKAISADPSIALKSLRLVNSAYYGLRQKVTSVEHAVVLLGMKVIRNLVFTATVFDTLQSGEEDLLRHSVCCGVVMRSLAKSGAASRVRFNDPEEAFVFGLLHDVGKIIFQLFMPKEYTRVAEVSASKRVPWGDAEREVIGVDHAELGARLAEKWKLTDDLVHAIAAHHDLPRCEDPAYRPHAALLCAADYICYAAGYPGPSSAAPSVDPLIWKETGLTSRSIVAPLEEIFASTDDIEELIKLAG